MVDKLFTDNDLLQEKSYDTRIAEKVDVKPDADYLEEDGFKKRLTEKIEPGGGDYTLRHITLVNKLSASIVGITCTIALSSGKLVQQSTKHVSPNDTEEFDVIASYTVLNKFSSQYIIFKTSATPTSVTSEESSPEIIPASNDYYILKSGSTEAKDITITIS